MIKTLSLIFLISIIFLASNSVIELFLDSSKASNKIKKINQVHYKSEFKKNKKGLL